MRDRFDICGAVIRIRKLSLLLVMTLRMPNTNSGPTLSLPENVLLEHFYLGLNKEATLHLNTASGGSFLHETINEGKAILEKILENTLYTGIFDEFPEEEKEIESSPEPKDKESIPGQEKEVLIVKSQPL
jgi:hypothetical protein